MTDPTERELEALRYLEAHGDGPVPIELVVFARSCAEKGWVIDASTPGDYRYVLMIGGKSILAWTRKHPVPAPLPPDGTTFKSWNEVPVEFRDGGRPDGEPLTAKFLGQSDKYLLQGPYLSKHRDELGARVKVGQQWVYQYVGCLRLRDRLTDHEDERY